MSASLQLLLILSGWLLAATLAWRLVRKRRDRQRAGKLEAPSEPGKIRDRVNAAANFAGSQQFGQRVAEVSPSILYVFDLQEQRNVFINRELFVTLGHTADFFEQYGPNAVSRLMHPDDQSLFERHQQHVHALADGEVAEFTYRMRTADGSWRWFYSRDAVFARDSNGRARQFIGAATDITAIKAAEEALRENNQRLEFVLSAANMGVWELDLRTHAVVWTQGVADIFGLPLEQAPKTLKEFAQLLHPEDRAAEQAQFERALASDALYQSEFRQHLPEGQVRWIAGVGRITRDASGAPLKFFGLAWNITARKRAEEEREQLERQLRQAQKMEALGAFAGGIAHDFNNVLTAISGNTVLALEELAAGHPARVSVEEIRRGAARAAEFVRRILSFSRKNESTALKPTDLRDVVNEAARLLRATIPAMIEIRVECAAELPPVMADATQMLQVLMNLGANARDAMSDAGGVLTIELRKESVASHAPVLAGELQQRGCVRLSVRDTGPGVAPGALEHIFEPFFTTKPPGRGTGMGLAVVHGIVRQHDGAIVASSPPGEGAAFDIYLPIAHAQPQPAASSAAAVPQGRGQRILYIDDEEPLVFLATRMLTRMGFEVEGQTDAAAALQMFRADPARWDLVITDLGMPGMSGLQLAAELQAIRADVPIIVTSGYVRNEDAERARAIGVHDIVLKPNTMDDMGQLIARTLGEGRSEAGSRREA